MSLKSMTVRLPVWLKVGLCSLWGRIAVETLLFGMLSCVPIISAKLSQYAIDEVVLERSMENLRTLLLLSGICVVAVLMLKYAVAWISAVTRQRFALAARLQLWSSWVNGVPPELHQPGEAANRLLGDAFTVGDITITYISSSVVSIVTLIVCLFVLFNGNLTIAWISVSIIPGFLLLYFVFAKRINGAAQEVRVSIDRLVGFIVERWTQLDEIRSLQGQDCECERFADAVNDQYGKGLRALFVQNLSSGVAETLMVAWSLFLFAIGVILILKGELTLGELIAAQMISSQLVAPLQRILNLNLSLQVARVASGRISEIEKTCEDVKTRRRVNETIPVVFELRDAVCHVSEIEKRDRRIGLFVKAIGRQILSGCNGSGKSSVCRIFAGLRYPVEGYFLVNGRLVKKSDFRFLTGQVLLLTHKPYFFSGTIRENLTYGLAREVADTQLFEVLRQVRLGSWVSALNGGLDYQLEAGGLNLSQGQRQRLNCARALLRRQGVIVIDEAMSGIERGDQAAIIDELGNGRCLIITRISTSPTVEVSSI